MPVAKVKLAVSMNAALVQRVKAVVGQKRAASVSAYVEHAVAAQLAAEAHFDALLEEALGETGGAPSRAERARARRQLSGAAA
jgi:hypothetical protein